MVATKISATPDVARAAAAHHGHDLGVALFHTGSPALPGLGGNLAFQAERDLPAPPSPLAWDFLSIALAAFAADRFVLRSQAEDGWTRVIDLDVAVHTPRAWRPQRGRLEGALRFLTGDVWRVTFSPGGERPPNFQPEFHDRDTVCLFSGGLDSLLGAIKLVADGKSPLLVSQGSTKEVGPQINLATSLGLQNHRFDGRVNEKWRPPYEGSTRGRSLIFFAYGVVVASALGLSEVIVPENGLIAINPPLTGRRLGSLSTRTTHPHFLGELEAVLAGAGIPICLNNIFEGLSKGEMLQSCQHPQKAQLASDSYSCGKGKRKNGQCGVCIPCLIRRASFQAGGVPDQTSPAYKSDITRSRLNDDVSAARLALARIPGLSPVEFERWVSAAGPLPTDPQRRAAIMHAVSSGMGELADFLNNVRWR